MSRLIDADVLMPNAKYKGKYDTVNAYDIVNCPTVDAEPVRHGYWELLHKTHGVDEDSDYDWRCSECGHVDCHNINVEVPYCWYCGAKMDESKEQSKGETKERR